MVARPKLLWPAGVNRSRMRGFLDGGTLAKCRDLLFKLPCEASTVITGLLSLSCVIYAGSGSMTVMPGIVNSPRYEQTSIIIQMNEDELTDIRVNGPWDRNWSYREHGFTLHADRSAGRWILTADSRKDLARETLILEDTGRLLWSQVADAPALNTAAVSIFSGSCEATREGSAAPDTLTSAQAK